MGLPLTERENNKLREGKKRFVLQELSRKNLQTVVCTQFMKNFVIPL